jgi:hypothetical protein
VLSRLRRPRGRPAARFVPGPSELTSEIKADEGLRCSLPRVWSHRARRRQARAWFLRAVVSLKGVCHA